MNDNSMKPTPTPIENKITEVLENQLTEAMSRAYNQALDHAVAIIESTGINNDYREKAFSDLIINQLNKLKK